MVEKVCGYGLVVERVLAKDEIGVRFSVPAPNKKSIVRYREPHQYNKFFVKDIFHKNHYSDTACQRSEAGKYGEKSSKLWITMWILLIKDIKSQ